MSGTRASLTAARGSSTNDALYEFEAFKKKFLLSNKHITKLNSSLSVRIEELSSQISLLYTENLRLRTSEIALRAELRREKEKLAKFVDEIEAKALVLTDHLGFVRKTMDATTRTTPSPPHSANHHPHSSPSRQRTQTARNAAAAARRQPNPISSPPHNTNHPDHGPADRLPGIEEDDDEMHFSSPEFAPPILKKAKPKLSSPTPFLDFTSTEQQQNKKPRRRESGLLRVTSQASSALSVPRPFSPNPDHDEQDEDYAPLKKKVPTKAKKQLRDVTNSPPPVKERKALVVVDNIRAVKDANPPLLLPLQVTNRTLTPPRSDSPEPPAEATAGRERRVRKSVNYAEPKLNTKMRKPDPDPSTLPPSKKKRVSAPVLPSSSSAPNSKSSTEPSSPPLPVRITSSKPSAVAEVSIPKRPSNAGATLATAPSTSNTSRLKSKIYILDESWEEDEGGDADLDDEDEDEYVPNVNITVERRRGGSGTAERRKTMI